MGRRLGLVLHFRNGRESPPRGFAFGGNPRVKARLSYNFVPKKKVLLNMTTLHGTGNSTEPESDEAA